MAKKKVAALPPCLHCKAVFNVPMRWCQKCETHNGSQYWSASKGMCDRCADGSNDEYNIRRVGHADRVNAALELAKDPKNWCGCGALEAFKKWEASPEYNRRLPIYEKVLDSMESAISPGTDQEIF
jgi:hypothetical protein